jgi:hypothetical protein
VYGLMINAAGQGPFEFQRALNESATMEA